jgi:hypothetical protein
MSYLGSCLRAEEVCLRLRRRRRRRSRLRQMRSGWEGCRIEQESSVHHRDPFTLFPNMGFDENRIGFEWDGMEYIR